MRFAEAGDVAGEETATKGTVSHFTITTISSSAIPYQKTSFDLQIISPSRCCNHLSIMKSSLTKCDGSIVKISSIGRRTFLCRSNIINTIFVRVGLRTHYNASDIVAQRCAGYKWILPLTGGLRARLHITSLSWAAASSSQQRCPSILVD